MLKVLERSDVVNRMCLWREKPCEWAYKKNDKKEAQNAADLCMISDSAAVWTGTALFCHFTHRIMVVSYPRFGTTCGSHLQKFNTSRLLYWHPVR